MARGAAFFDLDRTIIGGASGPVINRALLDAGVRGFAQLPGEHLLYRLYDLVGETLPSMALARGAAVAARGKPTEAVRRAGVAAADRLEKMVNPYVAPLLADHRRAGHPVVLATTTPHELVAPLARRLGMDDVVATRWSERDGTYTGGIDGPFVWAGGKLAAVSSWCRSHEVDLGESYAYSDSLYDTALLTAVGHPFAVNPDPRLRAVATLARWPVMFLDVPPGVPKLAGLELVDLVRHLARPEVFPYARFDIGAIDPVPAEGPAIVVANHRSYFDVVAMGLTVLRRGRPLRFLAKREIFDAPVVGQLARALGGIKVDRGSGSDEPLRDAARALAAGELVAVLPQGTIPRGPAFFDPVLKGRPGVARLAAMSGAPVVPVGLWGTEAVWPRSERMPRFTGVLRPPLVTTRVGAAVALEGDDLEADTRRIMAAITDLLPPEARTRRRPSAAELALTYPPGHRGDEEPAADHGPPGSNGSVGDETRPDATDASPPRTEA
jgi:putative phosphoserine phosphatase/1-acylglycerol-3-phosphate O-acyltransferase